MSTFVAIVNAPAFLALVGFVFTFIVGQKIVYDLQKRNWERQEEIKEIDAECADVAKVFDDFVTISGRRYYATFRLLFALESDDESGFSKRYERYDHSLHEWNEKLFYFTVKLSQTAYVGLSRGFVEEELTGLFYEPNRHVEALIRERKKLGVGLPREITEAARRELREVSEQINRYGAELYTKLRTTRRSRFDRAHEVSKENFSRLSTWDLFDALFKLRKYP
jgi:hypothetical protein